MANKKLKVGIIGLGMVGGPIKRWFEEHRGYVRGKTLFCYDVDSKKGFTDDVNRADIIFVSVPTPANPDGSCNTTIVESAVAGVNNGKIIVVKSTIPPGTVHKLQKKFPKKRLIFNPEFLTESQAWEDFISPDRQIVGPTDRSMADSIEVLNLLPQKNFIRPWTSDYAKKSVNSTEAEFGKYASNVFGYIKVVYGNILADLCYAMNKSAGIKVDYDNIKELIGADLRIGPSWLNVDHGNYCGAGGYCFPKDMNAFIAFSESLEKDAIKNKGFDKEHLRVLKSAIAVLKSIRSYNKTLILAQGLSMEDVSRHNKEIILQKSKKIRK
jgi:nucleotide sugar dehydrogenase